MKEYKTLRDIFVLYPYVKKHSKGYTRPSLKNCSIVEDHPLSMEWIIWSRVIKIYLKHTKDFLLSGNKMYLPSMLGALQLVKTKRLKKKKPNYGHYAKTGEWKYYDNELTMGYIPSIQWKRRGKSSSWHKCWYWKARAGKALRKEISQMIVKDPTFLYALDNATVE